MTRLVTKEEIDRLTASLSYTWSYITSEEEGEVKKKITLSNRRFNLKKSDLKQ